jgi:hypothetical protein
MAPEYYLDLYEGLLIIKKKRPEDRQKAVIKCNNYY